jgi:serine/threonine protein kinase
MISPLLAIFLSILYRDLKPQNIGLDDNGRVKMFDFGLAKELKPQFQVDIDQYKGRMETGSRRYMAPEVYSSDLYGLPADVYSFTVLFWQLLSLQLPFKGLSLEVYAHKVYVKKYRPAVKRNWSKKLKKIIVKGWDHNPSRRPKMNDFLLTLEEYLTFCY